MNGSAYGISFCNILEVWGLSGWSSDSWDRTLTHWHTDRDTFTEHTLPQQRLSEMSKLPKTASVSFTRQKEREKHPESVKTGSLIHSSRWQLQKHLFPTVTHLCYESLQCSGLVPLWRWRLFLYVNLSLSSSQSFFRLLSPLFLAGDKPWRGYRRLEGNVSTEQHAKSNPPAGLSLALPFSDTVCLSFHPRDLARRQTYASELLRTSTFCQGMCVGFWRRLTSVTCYYVLLFVWGERHGEGWVIRSPRIDFLFLSESCEAAKWCGFANVCMSFTVFKKYNFAWWVRTIDYFMRNINLLLWNHYTENFNVN